jgi:hypothetical protein
MIEVQKELLEEVFSAIRKYQHQNLQDATIYDKCQKVLNELYELTYTQQKEQVR